jgi:hypothetical protein
MTTAVFKLSQEQEKVIAHRGGHLQVIACAGAGKTEAISRPVFPDKSAWEKLSKALGGVVDPERLKALSGTVSLPFPAGKHKCVAVKVIDPRGNELMHVHRFG